MSKMLPVVSTDKSRNLLMGLSTAQCVQNRAPSRDKAVMPLLLKQ